MKNLKSVLILLTLPLLIWSCKSKYNNLNEGVYAEFQTNQGTILTKLYNDATPLTVANFVSLAEGTNGKVSADLKGKKFYDGLTFHRVIKDFMIQGGDPKGDGTGGPGYAFPDEIVDSLNFDRKGLLAMANSGPATNGSQFFITLEETPWLNGRHTIFGEVIEGQDVVDKIGEIETEKPGDKPKNAVIIEKLTIIKKGKAKVSHFTDELTRIEQDKKEKEARVKKTAEKKALELAALREKAETLESGVQIYFNKKGDQEKPNMGDRVLLDYAGFLKNGQLFDTSILEVAEENEMVNDMRKAAGQYKPMPTEYSLDSPMIPGFKEGMLNMSVGDKATIFIPAHLAYGQGGVPGLIPPNSDLIFELEIRDKE